MKISHKILNEISNNTYITFTEQEANYIYGLVKHSIDDIKEILNLQFNDVEPMSYPEIEFNHPFREDVVKQCVNKNKMFKYIKNKKGKYIKI